MELVYNASEELFPNNTQSSFTKFSLEQRNLENQWEVAISELSYPSMYQNITEGNLSFLTSNFRSPQNSTIWNLAFTSHYRYCCSHEHSQLRKTQSQRKLYHS